MSFKDHFTKPFNPLPWHASPHDHTGDNVLGPHTVETTQRYIYGTRFLTWDGRVFKYGRAGATCYSYRGVARMTGSSADSVYATNPVNGGQIGDRHITATLASSTFTGDELAGGYVFIYDKSSTNGNIQRGIIGNEATSTTTKIYLDYPLQIALIGPAGTNDAFEVFNNPYRILQNIDEDYEYAPWMGVPARNATVGQNFWLQTWGPCITTPGEAGVYAPAANSRSLVWAGNGSLHAAKSHLNATGYQYAGYQLVVGTAAYGPLFMLMCST